MIGVGTAGSEGLSTAHLFRLINLALMGITLMDASSFHSSQECN